MLESELPTPCYLIDQAKLKENLVTLSNLRDHAGCRVLYAQKVFSSFPFYTMIARWLDGMASVSCYEAQLAHQYVKGENHICATAYLPEEWETICAICDHVVFNSPNQLRRYGGQARALGVQVGLRLNPECLSQQLTEFDPCAPYSRLGTTLAQFPHDQRKLLSGVHVHALYEQNADALE